MWGVKSLNERFDRFCREGLKHYYRFMDNIFIMHEDKVFLRLMAELAVMHLARDWKLSINKSWNIHRTCDGIDFCGQKIFADHALCASAPSRHSVPRWQDCANVDLTMNRSGARQHPGLA